MKKVILIPDSFKGTMSSAEICTVMAQAVQEYYPDAQVHSVPVADGGEGSVDSFLQAVGGEKVSVTVKGPYSEEVPAFYGMLPDGVAVIEMAAAAFASRMACSRSIPSARPTARPALNVSPAAVVSTRSASKVG